MLAGSCFKCNVYLMQSDVNTVSFADESGNLIYSGSDDNLCKVNSRFFFFLNLLHTLQGFVILHLRN